MKRWQSILLGVVVSVATLAYALRGVKFDELRDEFVRGRYIFVLPTLVLVVLGLALRAVRWRVLLSNRISLKHSFHILNVSYLLNTILPLRLGEVGRAVLTTRLEPPISVFAALSSTVVERLTDVIAVVVCIILAIAIAPVTPAVEKAAYISGVLAIIGTIVVAVFAARPVLAHRLLDLVLKIFSFLERFRLRNLAEGVLQGIAPLGTLRGALSTFFWTAVSWATSIAMTYVLLFVFYDHPTLNAALLMVSLTSLAIALPAVPGSVGPFEAAMVTGLTLGGMVDPNDPAQQARAVACAVLIHVVTTACYAFLGWIGLQQEKISLGDLLRAARQLGVRQKKIDVAEPAAE